MRITLHGHACVRLEKDGRVLVIDPGVYSDLSVLEEAEAVLVTHVHRDHVDVEHLASVVGRDDASRPSVLAPGDVVDTLVELLTGGDREVAPGLRTVVAGDRVTVAGFDLELFGGEHAVVHRDVARVPNVACLVDGMVVHPGDSFAPLPPGRSAEVLLLPVDGPWLKLAEAVDYAREVDATTVVPIHDGLLNDKGRATADRIVGGLVGDAYSRIGPGRAVALVDPASRASTRSG